MANWYSDQGADAATPDTKLIIQIPNQSFCGEKSFKTHYCSGLENNPKHFARNLKKLKFAKNIEDFVSTVVYYFQNG